MKAGSIGRRRQSIKTNIKRLYYNRYSGKIKEVKRMNEQNKYKYFLTEYVESITKPGKTKGFYICPLCGSGTGNNQTAAFQIAEKGAYKGTRWKCFACNHDGDIIDLIALHEGVNTAEAFTIARKRYEGKPAPATARAAITQEPAADYSAYIARCAADVDKTDYITRVRGLSAAIIERYKLGYNTENKNIVIPYPDENYYIERGTGSTKFFRKAHGSEPIYNKRDIYNDERRPVFITEGQLDALSIIDAGGYAAALGSTSNAGKLLKQLKEKPTDNIIILCFDRDEAGENAADHLYKELQSIDIKVCKFNYENINGFTGKDANEAIIFNYDALADAVEITEREALETIENAAEAEHAEYIKGYAINKLDNFINEIKTGKNNTISTGFKELDKALDGGLFPGLFILGAESSLGKSTITLNIAENIAEAGTDILYFSLEMAERELMARSISKCSYLIEPKNAKTTKEILKGNPDEYAAALDRYRNIAKHLYLYEDQTGININDIKNIALEHKRITGNTPIIILDYLQLIAPISAGDIDKVKIDYTVKGLKQLSQQLNTPVIAISSVNRDGYGSRVTMKDFKESGAIEFSSDVLFGLNLAITLTKRPEAEEVNKALKETPRHMVLEILKNRNGERNKQIQFAYYSAYNYFNDSGLDDFRAARQKTNYR